PPSAPRAGRAAAARPGHRPGRTRGCRRDQARAIPADVTWRGSAAAARELGDDPARGERAAEGHERALADQLRGAVTQLAALVHDVVVLLACRAPELVGRGPARAGAARQVVAHLLGAAAPGIASRAGRTTKHHASIARSQPTLTADPV